MPLCVLLSLLSSSHSADSMGYLHQILTKGMYDESHAFMIQKSIMKTNDNICVPALTDFAQEQAQCMDDINEIKCFLRDDFPIRTVKEELEKEIELRAAALKTTRDEIIRNLRKKCGEVNVNNWLSGKAKALTKESALKIAFALQMNAKEASWFLMQSCWLDGLYMRDYKDIIYRYCLDEKLEYKQAEALIEQHIYLDSVPNPDPVENDVSGERLTEVLARNVKRISSVDELNEFILKNKFNFGSFRRLAYEKFIELYNTIKYYDEIRETSRTDGDLTDEEICKLVTMSIPSLKGKQSIINTVLKKIAEDPLPRTTLTEIKGVGKQELRGSKRITEVKRKQLLLMWLYVKAGTPDCNEYSDRYTELEECINIINDTLLEPCGMPLLDPRNPFDWIIMNALYCVCFTGDGKDEDDDTVERIVRVIEQLFRRGDEK